MYFIVIGESLLTYVPIVIGGVSLFPMYLLWWEERCAYLPYLPATLPTVMGGESLLPYLLGWGKSPVTLPIVMEEKLLLPCLLWW